MGTAHRVLTRLRGRGGVRDEAAPRSRAAAGAAPGAHAWFDVENAVDCFGMDNFYIDEEAPGVVPLPSSAWLGISLLGLLGVARGVRRRPAVQI